MIIYMSMFFFTIPNVEKYANGMKIFDLSPGGYSFAYANELLTNLGRPGRYVYLHKQLPLDFLYPGLFAISSCILLSWLFLKSISKSSKIFYLCFIPIIAGIFDYTENLFIVSFIERYPGISPIQVGISSIATIVKSVSTALYFIVLLFAVITYFIKRIKVITKTANKTN